MGALQGERLTAHWFSPRNGELIAIGSVDNEGEVRFDPPGEALPGNDWALILEHERGGDPRP